MNTQHPINDDFIVKYLCGEASPEEAVQMEAWKAASPQNQQYFNNMEQTYLRVYDKKISSPDKQKAWLTFSNKVAKKSNPYWMYGLAAIFLVGLVAVMFLMKRQEIPSEMYAEKEAIHKILNDKSEITLDRNSRITFGEGFGKNSRQLKLSGKAAFTVTHNAALPFIIESDGVYIEDLGTVFTVESQPKSDTVYVVVNEGIVRLYDEHGSEIIIKAGEKAWYIRSQKKIITDIDSKTVKFDFKDTRLADAVALLEETYDIDIRLMPESIGDCKITTQFFDEEVATIITVITETLGFKYQFEDHHYKIEGKPCQ
ncbi:MAG: FecR domain-containing protein [Saprospiraceae bacterium]|nr:FecR domain-containing protein [Saprospiraceae bacterium]